MAALLRLDFCFPQSLLSKRPFIVASRYEEVKHTKFRNQVKQKEALTPFALGAGRKWVEAQCKWTVAATAMDNGRQALLFLIFFMSEVFLYFRTETHHSQSMRTYRRSPYMAHEDSQA